MASKIKNPVKRLGKKIYMAKVAGIIIEISKPTYDLMVKKDEEYMESLKALDINYTNLFDEQS